MKNLKLIRTSFLKIITILFFSILSINALSSENTIIFKINDKAFTTFDLNMRLQYLDFVGSNENLSREIVIDDFISVNLFFEYYLKLNNKNSYENKVKEIYQNIIKINKENNKEYSYNVNKENILLNLKLDYIRKTIIENYLNSDWENINKNTEDIDLLYDFSLTYINFKNPSSKKLLKKIEELENKNIDTIKLLLEKNNVNFFFKQDNIDIINNVHDRIKQNILNNNDFLIIKKNKNVSVIFINKYFETFDSLIATLYSIKTNEIMNKNDLLCKNLKSDKINQNLISKDYKFNDLNDRLKSSLVNIDDFVKLNDNENNNIYIILCDIKYDKKKLSNININKLINSNVEEIENKFIQKYSKIFNLIKIDE